MFNCKACARRREGLKKYIKTVFKGVQNPENSVISEKFVEKINAKYGKKRP